MAKVLVRKRDDVFTPWGVTVGGNYVYLAKTKRNAEREAKRIRDVFKTVKKRSR